MNLKGVIRLFRLWGIDVFLHWSWIVVALYEIQLRRSLYRSMGWNILEYVTLFAIVLMHEFGHALACRSVGGIANRIILWPLGGIAFVQPPQRPGAYLWSIAAGPLVNVALLPITFVMALAARRIGVPPDGLRYVDAITSMNLVLLLFNLVPIYPLDGGQILRSILWFFLGPIKSLRAASILGIVGIVLGVGLITLFFPDPWLYIIAVFAAMQCFVGLKQAKLLEQHPEIFDREHGPVRRPQMRCPSCGQAAPVGNYWRCTCGQPFDTFATGGVCPRCGTQHYVTACPDCHALSPLPAWYGQMGQFPVVFNTPPAFNSGETPQHNPQAPL